MTTIINKNDKSYFDFNNIICGCTRANNIKACKQFEIVCDDSSVTEVALTEVDDNVVVLGPNDIKHPERIIHKAIGHIRISKSFCKELFNDICSILKDDEFGCFDSSREIKYIIIGTDGSYTTKFTVVDNDGNGYRIRDEFIDSEVVKLLVIIYNITGIADKICKEV